MQNKKVNYIDITRKVLNNDKKEYKVEEQKYFVDNNGNRYNVDGKHVIMQPSQREKEVADLMGKIFGGEVNIIPRINYPKKINLNKRR